MSDNIDPHKGKEMIDDPISQLPKAKGWLKPGATLYQGCWLPSEAVANVMSFQQTFQPQDDDIILASVPKSGTTWLKSLLFSILNRSRYTPENTPLLTTNPHWLVPSLEYTLFSDPPMHDLHQLSAPRLLATHLHYASLGDTARVVFVCRNPLDTIVSFWHFAQRGYPQCHDARSWSMWDCVDAFCSGHSWFGPFWSHVLGFWRASLENPEKVLFLTYEDVLEEKNLHVKKIAEFVGFPFSPEEENDSVVEQIIELCSLKKLSELDVNMNQKLGNTDVDNKLFFRKGEVGDWVNHLSPDMVDRVRKVIEEKLCGSGLTFKFKI